MGYLTVKQLSEKWKISERRIVNLCRENRISGAIKNGMVWMIPEDTVKPADKRTKIVQYINTEKRVAIINGDKDINFYLIPLLNKEGYIVETICDVSSDNIGNLLSKYYDGLVFVDLNSVTPDKEKVIRLFAERMNSSSGIVLVNGKESAEQKLEVVLADELKKNVGVRINSINLMVPAVDRFAMNYDEISEDIVCMLTKFKNSTGLSVQSDGGLIEFDKNGRSRFFEVGEFYKVIENYFRRLDKNQIMWCASTMLEDEWTEEPLEMNFRVINLDAANRGVNVERIFIFSRSKVSEFKDNKTLNIYMHSNLKTMFVDYDEILEKEPELLDIVGAGWDGIDMDTLILDLPEGSKERGYVSVNKKEVQRAYECFKRLKYYAKDLKEVLK